MTRVWYHKINGQAAVFDINEDMSSWPDYVETNPNPPPAITTEQKARNTRDFLLAVSDTMALVDRVTDEWKTYRQALRDLPTTNGWPETVNWPKSPEGN